MNRVAFMGLIPLAIAAPAAAQDMGSMPMPAMTMPAPKTKPPAKPAKQPATPPPTPTSPHAGHDMSAMPGMSAPRAPAPGAAMADMPGMKGAEAPSPGQDMAAMPGMSELSEPEIPNSPPPPPPKGYAADRVFDPASMAAARDVLHQEHGGVVVSQVMANLAEYQARSGGAYRWDGQAWFGGDINRFVLKSEGEGSRRDGLDSAELQGLYSRAVSPYFDLQAGVRQDFKPRSRTYVTVGVEGLAPYWFDVEGALFLSNKGELLGRLEGTYDLRLTQRLILQPRVELNLSAQDTAETRTGSGLSNAELGLRLRYEIRREFAPYIGISYDRKFGGTADYARALGEGAEATAFVVGVRAWF